MRLAADGHPIHTRALSATLGHRGDGRLDASGYVIDLRKRGVVPVAGDLQGPGIVHHMLLDAVIDPGTRVIEEIASRQPNVAFEASPITAGESCRDPAARVEALRGTEVDQDYPRRLSAAIGGPRGCSHVLTLAQFLGSAAGWAFARGDVAGTRRAGERIFRRDVVLDGQEPADRRFDIALQLTDMAYAPAEAITQPMLRFGRQHEVRAVARIDLSRLALSSLDVAERHRTLDTVGDAEWRERPDVAEALVAGPVMHGSSALLLQRRAANPADAPIYDALLMLAPTMIQCFATLSDAWLVDTREADTLIGMGGIPDSCYMWRRGGALDRKRRRADPMPGLAGAR